MLAKCVVAPSKPALRTVCLHLPPFISVILFLGRLGFLGRRPKDPKKSTILFLGRCLKILNYLVIYTFVNVIA